MVTLLVPRPRGLAPRIGGYMANNPAPGTYKIY
jgi:hypothetical protein